MNRDEDVMNASGPGKTSTTSNEKKEGTIEDVLEQHPFAVTLLEKHQEQQQQNDLSSPPTKGENEKPTTNTNEMSRARRKKTKPLQLSRNCTGYTKSARKQTFE